MNVLESLSVLPSIPITGSCNVFIKASLNFGRVVLDKSDNPWLVFIILSMPRSLSISAAPAPPAKALPNEFAASVAVVPMNAARSVIGLIRALASAPNACNCAPALTTSSNVNGVVAASELKFSKA